ncbi:hypothetical protein GWK47_053796 [Chionoecetes opilio]|uniref:Uncharacterized protein n=1 Tax=Chionoecetes opilio TaxID=41210 RepID=A0A8J5CR26_CHIOP|nr:hypothetical protein GWK47_053796 [Chionoecetes opilio]
MNNRVASVLPVEQHQGSNGQCSGGKVLGFHVEGREVQTCDQHHEMEGGDPASATPPTCLADQSVVHPITKEVEVTHTASKTHSCNTKRECEPVASHGHSTTRESVLPHETSERSSVANGGNRASDHQFFLPSDDEADSAVGEPYEDCNGHTAQSTPPLGLQLGLLQEPRLLRSATTPGKTGVQLCGSHHIFTVVPVGSGELHTNCGEPQTCAASKAEGTDSKPVVSGKSQILPGYIQYSPYSSVKVLPIGCRPAYSPYQTVTRGGNVPTAYHPYHTITGLEPTSYQRSENGLRRVNTSRREYGVGGTSVPPSLVNVALSAGAAALPFSSKVSLGATGAPILTGLHRVRTMPNPSAAMLRVFQEEGPELTTRGSDGQFSLENATMNSINQLTVCSAGSLSIDVGSTDGRNLKIHGAVDSPEQLPLLPSAVLGGRLAAADGWVVMVHMDHKTGREVQLRDHDVPATLPAPVAFLLGPQGFPEPPWGYQGALYFAPGGRYVQLYDAMMSYHTTCPGGLSSGPLGSHWALGLDTSGGPGAEVKPYAATTPY